MTAQSRSEVQEQGRPAQPMTTWQPAQPTGTLVELNNASKWYGNVVAVNDITMTIGPGLTGLLGPNGAGKSTLLHMMAGFLAPSRGEVLLGGHPTWRNIDVYRRLGLVTERDALYEFLTGWEFVYASAKLHKLSDPRGAARRAIDLVEMAGPADRRIQTYSKGMRQRIKVAGAFVHDPQVLLLDEPFNGMDPRQRLHMMELLHGLAGQGRTILFSSHILAEVERLSGTVQVIVSGRLAASGDYRHIRRLMTNRPHLFQLRSSDDRRLASVLIADPSVAGVELADGLVTVRAADYGEFTHVLPRIARKHEISLREILNTDESLDSVFAYLVDQ